MIVCGGLTDQMSFKLSIPSSLVAKELFLRDWPWWVLIGWFIFALFGYLFPGGSFAIDSHYSRAIGDHHLKVDVLNPFTGEQPDDSCSLA